MIKKLIFLVLLFCTVLIVGCGGGGSGGIAYTGKTTPASITEENGEEIVVEAIGANDAGPLGGFFGAAEIEQTNSSQYYPLLTRIVSIIESQSFNYYSAATETIPGSCGGSLSATGSETSGSATFRNFCDESVFGSGKVVVNGSISFKRSEFSDEASLNFSNFTIKGIVDGTKVDAAMSGSMEINGNGDVTISMVVMDNVSNETSKVENFKITTSFSGVSIEGRIYSAEYGYVDLSTITPLDYSFSGNPTRGKLEVVGKGGSNAIITFSSNGTYTLTIDEDGDGIVDSTTTDDTSNLELTTFE